MNVYQLRKLSYEKFVQKVTLRTIIDETSDIVDSYIFKVGSYYSVYDCLFVKNGTR